MIFGRRPGVAVVELHGPDTRRFANGMFTNNVRDLPVGAHQWSAMTDDRGRIHGLMDAILVADDRLVCVLEGMTADDFESRYGMFIVFDDVEMVRREGTVWTFQGPPFPPVPEAEFSWPSRRSPLGGLDVFVPSADVPPSIADLEQAEPELLEAHRIAVGWPRFPLDASAKQLPHELGLRDTHLHFEKGCYRGQETIHRVEVMGQVRKGLVGLTLDAPIDGGADLTAGGKKVGRMGSSAVHPELGRIGLAVVRTSHGAPGTELFAGEVRAVVRELT